jgi:hypothetical protein
VDRRDADGAHRFERVGHLASPIGGLPRRHGLGSAEAREIRAAEKLRPAPRTITTFTSGWVSNQRAAAASSPSVAVESGLSFSGRSSVS